jgi:hypothetical protein
MEDGMSLNNRSLLIAAVIAGVLMAILSSIPIVHLVNCLLCAWLWLGGMFAVWYYKRENPSGVTPGQGALIGAAAGLIGAVLAAILGLIFGGAGMAAALEAQREVLGDAADQIIAMMAGGLGVLLTVIFNLVFYTLFGAIGGLIGAALFGKPKYGQPGQPGPYVG